MARPAVSRVSAKGQVTIPLQIRKLLGVKPGDKVVFTIDHGRVQIARSDLSLESIYRCVPALGQPLSDEEAVAIAAAEHAAHVSREGARS